MNRRYFFASAASVALVRPKPAAASDTVNVAIMGVRGRGRALTQEFVNLNDVRVAALCDVDPRVVGRAAQIVEKSQGKQPPLIGDIRRILDDKSIDAIVVATPDHWHAPATLLACAAGKDVYVEKPASHNFREGRMMVEAARRHNRVVQMGTQARSRESTRHAIEYAQSGKLGRVHLAKAWNLQLRENIGRKPDSSAPAGVDYDTWTGPAPLLPFNENRFHYHWHWHWNYGTGDMGNDGVHQLDQARWALGVDLPRRASGMAAKLFFDDDQQTPDTMNIAFDYGDRHLIFEMRDWNPYAGPGGDENGVAIFGSDGFMMITSGFSVFDSKGKLVFEEKATPDTHARDFIDCVKSRQRPNADIETGHISTTLCHLGNIVARTGRAIAFDVQTQSIFADAEANQLLGRSYRKHWSMPRA
jgi:predicted dehydrogenase